MSKETDPVLLAQLVELYHEDNFDASFERLTKHLDKPARFLLKMEVKRMLNPCRRVIDMRQRFGDDCERIEYKNIPHFIPASGVDEFHRLIKKYNNQYTMGVYELMMVWEKRQLEAEKNPTTSESAQTKAFKVTEVKGVPFASYHARRDERMHFITPVSVMLPDGTKVNGKTSDISTGGIRINVAQLPVYEAGVEVYVVFEELQKEFPDVLSDRAFSYQLLGDETRNDRCWLRLVRIDDGHSDFDEFIEQFIHNNKNRYRVSVDYMLSSVLIKGHEQYFLPRMSGLPLYFSDSPHQLQFILKNENNSDILNYWYNEHNQNMLANVFTEKRLKFLMGQKKEPYETVIYCFTHTKNRHIFFYSALIEELQQQGTRKLFCAFGAKRQNWRVFKFSIEVLGHEEESGVDNATLDFAGIHSEHDLRERLEEISHVGYIQDITDSHHVDDFLEHKPEKLQANHLKRYCQDTTPIPFDVQTLHYLQLRKETRYTYRAEASVTFHEETLDGITKDLSANGLQIELDEPFQGRTSDEVLVSLPGLQKLTKEFNLKNLHYEIRHLNHDRTIMHLAVSGRKQQHPGRLFLNDLIEANPDKLNATEDPQHIPEISSALRNIYTYHTYSYGFFLKKLSNRAKLSSLGLCMRERSLHNLLSVCSLENGYNLYPLFNHKLLKSALMEPLRAMPREAKPTEIELFIFQRKIKENVFEFVTQHETEFEDYMDKKRFIQQAINQGHFYSIRIYLSRTGDPDTEFIAKEMDYLAHYAIHRARMLEEELWSIIAVGEIVDTTHATLFRFGIKASDLEE